MRGRRIAWVSGAAAAVLLIGVGVAWLTRGPAPATSAPAPSSTRTPTSSAPTSTPTPTGFPANTAPYDLDALPTSDVFAVIPAIPVDDAPYGSFTGEAVRVREWAAPVFADPLAQPVSRLLRDFVYGGTTVPVVERQDHWVKVLLTARIEGPGPSKEFSCDSAPSAARVGSSRRSDSAHGSSEPIGAR
jgi:hypothetical protein